MVTDILTNNNDVYIGLASINDTRQVIRTSKEDINFEMLMQNLKANWAAIEKAAKILNMPLQELLLQLSFD